MGQEGAADANIDASEAWDITTGSSDNDIENAAYSGASMDTTHISGAALAWDPFLIIRQPRRSHCSRAPLIRRIPFRVRRPSGGGLNVYGYLFVITMILYAVGAMFALCFFKRQMVGITFPLFARLFTLLLCHRIVCNCVV